MADSLDQFLRTTKVLYEDVKNELQAGKQGIDRFLFPVNDLSTSANFTLDKYTTTPYGIVFRGKDEQSHVRPYVPGTGQIFEVPRASEKTPISEQLRDAVVAGIESTQSFDEHNVKMVSDIIRDHTVGHEVTRWKLAIDVIRTGKFSPTGIDGNEIGDIEIDFERAAAQDITYDFTDTSATIDSALKAISDRADAYGMSKMNRVLVMGSDWVEKWRTDEDVQQWMQANPSNNISEQSIEPPEIRNTQGLYRFARYLPSGCIAPFIMCTFNPDAQYTAYKGATATDFFPSDEAVLISLDTPRYRIFRGVDALNAQRQAIRTVGEIVFDSYVEYDPVTEFLRSQARFAFIPADINKTVRSTGTFSES